MVSLPHLSAAPPGDGSLRNLTAFSLRKELPMGAKSSSILLDSKISPPQSDGDGNAIDNEILLALPATEREYMLPRLEFLRMKLNQLAYEQGDSIKSAYFCNSGIISMLNVTSDGESVEVGLVGKEGFLGLPLIAGLHTSNARAVVQSEGTAFRVDAHFLTSALPKCPQLTRHLHRYSQFLNAQVTQIATCNRLHEVEQRLARWLLLTHDRLSSNSLPLTQEFMSQMLGTRRSSVTVAAGALQNAGLIACARGSVTILDRAGLERAACDCYDQLGRLLKVWRTENE